MHLVDIGAADIIVTLSNGARVPASAPGGCPLGVCRIWVPNQEVDLTPNSDDGDVVRIFTEETQGFWYTFSFPLDPQGGQGPTGPQGPQESDNLRNFREAIEAARQILQGDNDCSRFFGGAGVAALNEIEAAVNAAGDNAFQAISGDVNTGIRMSIPSSVPQSDAPVTTTGVYASVAPTSITINTNGAFVRSVAPGGAQLPRFGGYGPGTLQSRVLQLLHETGHLTVTNVSTTFVGIRVGNQTRFYRMSALTHLLPLDGSNANLSEQNTESILNACRQQIDALRR